MARYTYKEIGDNKDSDCLTTVIYDGMDIMAIIYDYGEEVEVEPKRDLTDEESDMVKQFCESLDYDARQKINESISIGENVDILDIYKQAREDFGELNQKSSLNESVKKKPETINEKLKRLDRKVFNEEFKTLDLAYNYSMINEDVVGKKVDMKTKQELRDFINREDDPEKIAKFMDVIINGDNNKKPNQLNNQRVQQSNIRTESLMSIDELDDLDFKEIRPGVYRVEMPLGDILEGSMSAIESELQFRLYGICDDDKKTLKKILPNDVYTNLMAEFNSDEDMCISYDTLGGDESIVIDGVPYDINAVIDYYSDENQQITESIDKDDLASFIAYGGFEDDDMNESLITEDTDNFEETLNLKEAKEQNKDIMEIFNRNGWTVMKQGPGLMAYNYSIEHDSTIELNQDALINFLENENHLIDDLDALSEDITFSFNATQEGHPTGTVTDWRKDSVEESLNEDFNASDVWNKFESVLTPEERAYWDYWGDSMDLFPQVTDNGKLVLCGEDIEFEDPQEFAEYVRYEMEAFREVVESNPDAYDEEEKASVGL